MIVATRTLGMGDVWQSGIPGWCSAEEYVAVNAKQRVIGPDKDTSQGGDTAFLLGLYQTNGMAADYPGLTYWFSRIESEGIDAYLNIAREWFSSSNVGSLADDASVKGMALGSDKVTGAILQAGTDPSQLPALTPWVKLVTHTPTVVVNALGQPVGSAAWVQSTGRSCAGPYPPGFELDARTAQIFGLPQPADSATAPPLIPPNPPQQYMQDTPVPSTALVPPGPPERYIPETLVSSVPPALVSPQPAPSITHAAQSIPGGAPTPGPAAATNVSDWLASVTTAPPVNFAGYEIPKLALYGGIAVAVWYFFLRGGK